MGKRKRNNAWWWILIVLVVAAFSSDTQAVEQKTHSQGWMEKLRVEKREKAYHNVIDSNPYTHLSGAGSQSVWRPAHRRRSNKEKRAEKGSISEIYVIQTNITSWRNNSKKTFALKGDIYAVQEPRLTLFAQQKARTKAAGEGYDCVFGKALAPNWAKVGSKNKYGTKVNPLTCPQEGR